MRVILLSPHEARSVLDEMAAAVEHGMSIRVADDDGAFKIKLGYGRWSPPLGVIEVEDW